MFWGYVIYFYKKRNLHLSHQIEVKNSQKVNNQAKSKKFCRKLSVKAEDFIPNAMTLLTVIRYYISNHVGMCASLPNQCVLGSQHHQKNVKPIHQNLAVYRSASNYLIKSH